MIQYSGLPVCGPGKYVDKIDKFYVNKKRAEKFSQLVHFRDFKPCDVLWRYQVSLLRCHVFMPKRILILDLYSITYVYVNECYIKTQHNSTFMAVQIAGTH